MREHMGLYRGKRVDNGEWVCGSLIAPIYGAKPLILQNAAIDDSGRLEFDYYFVDPDTVGECTGLRDKRDKNGKLIFEGDIVKVDGVLYEVRMWEGRWRIFDRHGYWVNLFAYADYAEIYSTVHDTPELLKGGEGDG